MSEFPIAPTLREFAVATYGRDGVQAACLTLQDVHGLDVNVALFAARAGAARGRSLRPKDIREIAGRVSLWRKEVVGPLHRVRRSLKATPPSSAQGEALADDTGEPAAPGPDIVRSNAAVVAGLPADAGASAAALASAGLIGSDA